MTYGIIAMIVVGIAAHFYISRRTNLKEQPTPVRKHKLAQNAYNDLRNQAFRATKEQLQLIDDDELFGLIMDWDLGDGTMTLVTFRTGDASMYLSSGGGVIGGGQHENVRSAVVSCLNTAERYLKSGEKVEHLTLPKPNSVNFYFLTTAGHYLIVEEIQNFEDESSQVYQLFKEANNVITELRLTSEKN